MNVQNSKVFRNWLGLGIKQGGWSEKRMKITESSKNPSNGTDIDIFHYICVCLRKSADLNLDPVQVKTFKRALEKTRWQLWLWKDLVYDDEGERGEVGRGRRDRREGKEMSVSQVKQTNV